MIRLSLAPRLPTPDEFEELFGMLVEMHAENGAAPLDVAKASARTWAAMNQGRTILARNDEGLLIGSLALVEVDFWYADRKHLRDNWLYVRPEHRNISEPALYDAGDGMEPIALEPSAVARHMTEVGAALADEAGMMVYIDITNPNRRRGAPSWVLESVGTAYIPFARSLRKA